MAKEVRGKPTGHQLMEKSSTGFVMVPQLFPSLSWGVQALMEEKVEGQPQRADLGVGTSLTEAEQSRKGQLQPQVSPEEGERMGRGAHGVWESPLAPNLRS